MQMEMEKQKAELTKQLQAQAPKEGSGETPADISPEQLEQFLAGLDSLTPREREICGCYVAGLTTADIMTKLDIKENTLKFHNKNLYGKLGVRSRRQLTELYRAASAGGHLPQ